MTTPPDEPGKPVPPGPELELPEERKTGGLSVDEWLAESRRHPQQPAAPANPYVPYGPATGYRPPASKAMAGWALGLSLALCIPFAFLVAIGLAIAVLVKSRDGRDHGRGLAIAALVVSAVVLLGNVAYVVVLLFTGYDDTERDAEGRVVEAGSATLDELRVGDCFTEPNLEEQGDRSTEFEASPVVDVVPCAEPHQAEVFHMIVLEGDDFPGQKAIDQEMLACLPEFKSYVGKPYRRSALDAVFYYPSRASWRFGDRQIICGVTTVDLSDLTGSVKGSRR